MKNFLRALRYAFNYRGHILFSVFCAFMAAGLWGLNISAVYPVLEILESNPTVKPGETAPPQRNMQIWVDEKINRAEGDIKALEAELENIKLRQKNTETWPESQVKDDEEHRITDDLKRVEGKLSKTRSSQFRYQQLKHYVIRHLPTDPFNTLAVILGAVVVGVALRGIFEFGQEFAVGTLTNRTVLDLRNRFYHKAIHQDLRQIQEGGSAELMSRFTNDLETLGNGLKILFGRVVGEPLRAMACLAIACWISWQLTILFVLIVVPAIYIMTVTTKKMKRATRRVLEQMGSLYKILQETFQGLRIVKAFTMEPYERRRFHDAARSYADRSLKVIRIDSIAGPMVELIGVMAVSLALLAGAYLVLSGEKRILGVKFTTSTLDKSALLLLYAQLIGMADPVRKLSSVLTKLQSSVAACDRVFSLMDRVPQVQANSDGPRLERHNKEIEFQNICFSYSPDRQILTNVCLRVPAGETIAILGANGSGKSTLLNLLPRFYDPDHGTILVDGQDIRKVNLRSLRKQIALVSQDPILFDDTIYNNIRYGSRKATPEQVEDAAKKAFAHDFIMVKGGYETRLGDLGMGLSGGEKQRIALARAILRDPTILILDEFSSAIDPVSDRLIHDALEDFKKGRTTFFITHKMHTVQLADRIIVLDNHCVAATGTHAELIANSPVYRSLYEAQFQVRAA
jgi:subfamily B ATP-binding cassette protein MsbA